MRYVKALLRLAVVGCICGVLMWQRSAAERRYRLIRELWNAVETADAQRAEMLLRAGADPNVRQNPAARPVSLIEWVHRLTHGAARLDTGPTALMAAVTQHDLAVAHVLLAHRAATDLTDPDGDTALVYAANSSEDEAVHALLAAGADPNRPGRYGIPPIVFALRRCRAASVLGLIRRGAHIGASLAIHGLDAISNSDPGVLELLLDRGLSLDARVDGFPLLSVAANEGNVAAMSLLLRRGADIAARDKHGDTALRNVLAMRRRLPEVESDIYEGPRLDASIRFLKSHGAKP